MKGPQFWMMMGVLALIAWFAVRTFVQSISDSVTSGTAQIVVMLLA